jgi:glycerol-3-phosphate dehydrogenase (NAD(P)+)
MPSGSRAGARPVAVIGATGWGTTLAVITARQGYPVRLLARTQVEADSLESARENRALLPGVAFPDGMSVVGEPAAALGGAQLVIVAVPSRSLRQNVRRLRGHLPADAVLVSATKGLEQGTCLRSTEVIAQELPEAQERLVALSGPNLSREIAAGQPAATVVASRDASSARRAQAVVASPRLRVYTSADVLGVELGGALKNIIALAAGISDGLGYGDNAKAALITRGLAEITRLGIALGANPLTFAGLAGLGDLVATCSSPLSRNRTVGLALAQGRRLEEVLAGMRQVSEGVPTTSAARDLARRHGVEMPITEVLYRVLFEGLAAQQAAQELLAREPVGELQGLEGWFPKAKP